MPSKKGGKKVVQAKAPAADKGGSIFKANKRTFSIGGDIPGKRDLGRFVKWPKYVRLQRQHAVLYKRLKVPPGINQFTQTLDKTNATELFRLLEKYRPEDKSAKKDRLKAEAEAKVRKAPLLAELGAVRPARAGLCTLQAHWAQEHAHMHRQQPRSFPLAKWAIYMVVWSDPRTLSPGRSSKTRRLPAPPTTAAPSRSPSSTA